MYLGVELVVVLLQHPFGTERPSDLFVGDSHQDHVTIERHVEPLQRKKRHQLDDALAFHVEGATPPDPAVRDLGAERIVYPARGVGRDDVHVMKEEERLRLSCALEPGDDNRLAGA